MTHIRSPFTLLAVSLPLCTFSTLQANDALLVTTPENTRQIRVEAQDVGTGAWELVARAHLAGEAGTTKLRLPADLDAQARLRVQTSTQAMFGEEITPLPWKLEAEPSERGTGAGAPEVDSFHSGRDEGVEESDIWQVHGDQVLFFNQYRGLQVFDVSDPEAPAMTGQLRYAGKGEQMYVWDEAHAALIGRNQRGAPVVEWIQTTGTPTILATLEGMSGSLIDTRRVGDFLYLATQEALWDRETRRTLDPVLRVYSFDLSDTGEPAPLPVVEHTLVDQQISYQSFLYATGDALLIALSTQNWSETDERLWTGHTALHAFRLEDGMPVLDATTIIEGQVHDKFSLDLQDDIIRLVTEQRGWITVEGERMRNVSLLHTYRWAEGRLAALDLVTMAPNESLRANLLDDDRAYVVTFEQIDPLFAVDTTDPSNLIILGELEIPGWSEFLEILEGDRLLSIGVEDSRVAVSLFDVSDPAEMTLASRVYLGPEEGYSWSEGNYDAKAINFFRDQNLLVLPYQTWAEEDHEVAMQLVTIEGQELVLGGTIDHENAPRRAAPLPNAPHTLVSVSGQEILTVDASDRAEPSVLAKSTISWSVSDVYVVGDYLLQLDEASSYGWGSWSRIGWWGEQPQASIVVSGKTTPDDLLTELTLPSPLFGHTLLGTTLLVLSPEGPAEVAVETATLWAYPVEVSDPLNPTLGEPTAVPFSAETEYLNGRWDATMLTADTLAWVPAISPYAYYDISFVGGGWYGGVNAFFTLEVSDPSAPALLDLLLLESPEIPEEAWGSFGTFTVVERKVYSTYAYSERVARQDEEDPWIWNHYQNLIEIDLSDPRNLAQSIGDTLGGELFGGLPVQDSEGAILFTREWIDSQNQLQAIAWDGVQTFLLDTVDWGQNWNQTQIQDRIYNLTRGTGAENPTSLSGVRWSEAGSFVALEPLPLTENAWVMANSADDYIIVNGQESLFVVQTTETGATLEATFPRPLSYWGHYDDATFIPGEALWLPVGAYGVEYLPVPTITPAAVQERVVTQMSATPWEELAPSSWQHTRLDAADTVGRLENLQWLFRAQNDTEFSRQSKDLGDGRRSHETFGEYLEHPSKQYAHKASWGWFYYTGDFETGVWAYTPMGGTGGLDWTWSSAAYYPYIYLREGHWAYDAEEYSNEHTRWIYHYDGSGWQGYDR